MKKIIATIVLFGFFSGAQVVPFKLGTQTAYATQGAIICKYPGSPIYGVKFDFDKARSAGFDRTVASYITNGIEQKPHHLATVKTNLVSANILEYKISGELSSISYLISMNIVSKSGMAKLYKGAGMPGVDLTCQFAR